MARSHDVSLLVNQRTRSVQNPKLMRASVVSLHASGSSFVKRKEARLILTANVGAKGDRHAGRDSARALLITSAGTYSFLNTKGLSLSYGSLGENIVLQDIRLHDLPIGSRLQIAETILELSEPCTVCKSLSEIDHHLPKLLYGKRGIYARVLSGGVIAQGDQVVIAKAKTNFASEQL